MRSSRVIIIGLLLILAIAALLIFTQSTTPDGNIVIDTEAAAEGFVALTDQAAEGFASMFANFFDQLYNTPQSSIVQLLMVIGGVILLFAGWRIYNWIVLIAGVLIGASTAVAIVGDSNMVIMLSALLIGAVIGGVIAFFAYYVAVFFIGAYVGIILVGAIATSLNLTPISIWVLALAALIGGILLIGLSFELLVLLASVVGAQLIVIALNLQPQAVWLLGLILLGVILQSYVTRRFGYTIRRRPSRNPLRSAV